ncbi:methyltransferase domain-containing protein [Microcoleus sp. FACHB-831]|nr:methyltransferase domain-containing protein [Microcoleus sp. FACHB-831]
MSITSYIPWWGKIAAKLVLSRLPIDYALWKKLALFKHGSMEQPSYAYEVFKQHCDRVKPDEGFVSLELGPGDSLFSAIISRAFGGSESYLIDNGAFAMKDMQPYRLLAKFLNEKGLLTPKIDSCQSLEEILNACSAHYLTQGLVSLQSIPDDSVDFIWSHAVLEHIKRNEFLDTMQELRRIIRKDGACSHQVDLRDHLGGALNNLRFSEDIWESSFMANSGFYTNRIQYTEIINIFKKAKFNVEVVKVARWPSLPTPRSKLSQEFQYITDEELCISGFSVLLKPI